MNCRTKLSNKTVTMASTWGARLWSDDVSDSDKKAFYIWLRQSPENERAWLLLQQIEGKFDQLPDRKVGQHILSHRSKISRRELLLCAGISTGSISWLANSYFLSQRPGIEFKTAIGQIREVILADGSLMVLNTHSQVRFDVNKLGRHLHLDYGEVMITTAHHQLPFLLRNKHGQVQPLGTRFTVRQFEHKSQVSVFEGRVAVHPKSSTTERIVDTHAAADFSIDRVHLPYPNDAKDSAWSKSLLVATRMPIMRFAEEIARYRSGIVRIDPELAELQVTGVFSLANTDQALRNLAQVMPVKIQFLSRPLVIIGPQ